MMEIAFSKAPVREAEVDLLAVPLRSVRLRSLFGELDRAFGKQLRVLAKEEGFEGKAGQCLCVPSFGNLPARRVLLVGVGEEELEEAPELLKLGATCAHEANKWKAEHLGIFLPGNKEQLRAQTEEVALGVLLASYRFERYKGEPKESTVKSLTLIVSSEISASKLRSLKTSATQAMTKAEGICHARDLVNEPPCTLHPQEFAKRAKAMARKAGLSCKVLGEKELQREGMNLFLAVGRGSAKESCLVHLTYKPKTKRRKKNRPVIALVGKGITFDSGGLSLKPSQHMLNMHTDMAGAAAVFGAMQVIGHLQPDVEVHGFLAAAENMTGADAFRLNDIITGRNGKTVEIHNTDAEGRLVLADTLAYACDVGATHIVDLATLTGACLVALGSCTAGLMSHSPEMAKNVLDAAQRCDEAIWELPLLKDIREGLKSPVADMKNIGARYGGTISAAWFLSEFVAEGVEWVHLDIAGPSHSDKDRGHWVRGGTGFGVATLVDFVSNM